MAESTPSPKRRRWLRISLRTFLVLFTVMCVTLGYWVYRAEQQRKAVEWVRANGGKVFYDFEVAAAKARWQSGPPESTASNWLRDQFGRDFAGTVEVVSLIDTDIHEISPISQLSGLVALEIVDSPVSDLEPLRRLNHLERLGIENTGVSDLSPLSGLTSLRELAVIEAAVQDVSFLRQLNRLQGLELVATDVEDISVLSELQNLETWYRRGKRPRFHRFDGPRSGCGRLPRYGGA